MESNVYAELKNQVTENYALVKLEDKVLDLDLEIYDPVNDEVINTNLSEY